MRIRSWIASIFKVSSTEPSQVPVDTPSRELCMEFCATMQMRTPWRVLVRHGERHTNSLQSPPQITEEDWEGIWIARNTDPRFQFLSEGATMASDVGYIPPDGGDYLRFLVVIRKIVEGRASVMERRKALSLELANEQWRPFVRKLGGQRAILSRFFPSFLTLIKGLPDTALKELAAAKLHTPANLAKCSDARLLAIKGIGPGKLQAIREAVKAAPNADARYVPNPAMGVGW